MDRDIPDDVVILDDEPVEVKNPYTQESVVLKPDAVAVYDWIKGCEMFGDYSNLRIGLDWFRQHEPEAYMVLLD